MQRLPPLLYTTRLRRERAPPVRGIYPAAKYVRMRVDVEPTHVPCARAVIWEFIYG